VAYGILPGGEFFPVVGKPVSDEITDAAEGQPLVGRLQDGHGDQRDVRVGRLDDPLARLFGAVLMSTLSNCFILRH